MNHFSLLINKSDLHQHQLSQEQPLVVKEGEIRVAVSRFSLTANNITYAVLGDSLSYWNFFPADDGFGKLPVWGFADVVESNCDEVETGERLYGYFPFGSQLVIQPAKVNAHGFMDGSAHRRELPTVYNHYVRTTNDPMYAPQLEDLQAIFRPLFSTSFLLDDFLAEHNFFDADSVILSSASSKTAMGCAFLMHQLRKDRSNYEIVGLTSTGNVEFVKGLGCYDRVVDYTDVEQLENSKAALFIDFAGNADLTKRVHEHYADQLKHSCVAGVSHWEDRAQVTDFPGPKPAFFFAPTQVTKRVEEWGQAEFAKRLAMATQAFFKFVEGKIEISEVNTPEQALQIFTDLLNGRMQASAGYIVRF